MKHKVRDAISFTSEDMDGRKGYRNFTSDYTISIDKIIYGSYVTMNRMSTIVYETFHNTSITDATHINVFIDLYSVLHQVFSRGYRTSIENYTSITPTLINMCGHYRQFFKSIGVTTTFYLVYSTNTHEINRKLVFGYNHNFAAKSEIKLFKDITNANFELMNMLCPYLPDIHFIKSENGYEVGVIIANLIEKLNDGNPNLVISKDLYPIQLCYKYPYTSYLFPIKKFHRENGRNITSDESIMIPLSEKDSHRIAFWNLIAIRRRIKPDQLYQILPENFMLVEALNGFPERDIEMLAGNINKCVKIVRDMGGNQIKVPVSQMYYNSECANDIPINLVESRYNALNLDFVLNYYKQDIESKSISLQNLDDNGTINMINAKYFDYNPINILNL